MIDLLNDDLAFSFPDIHPHATLRVSLMRTLRVPDDDREYTLPDLGRFRARRVPETSQGVSASGPLEPVRADAVVPMYRTEALWLSFSSEHDYPFAVTVSAAGINALTGVLAAAGRQCDPQDYLVAPEQSWLGGWRGRDGMARQFTAREARSGIRIDVTPLRREAYERTRRRHPAFEASSPVCYSPLFDIGIQRGSPRHEILADPYAEDEWARANEHACVVAVSADAWRPLTSEAPPARVATEDEYRRAGIPWPPARTGDEWGATSGDANAPRFCGRGSAPTVAVSES